MEERISTKSHQQQHAKRNNLRNFKRRHRSGFKKKKSPGIVVIGDELVVLLRSRRHGSSPSKSDLRDTGRRHSNSVNQGIIHLEKKLTTYAITSNKECMSRKSKNTNKKSMTVTQDSSRSMITTSRPSSRTVSSIFKM